MSLIKEVKAREILDSRGNPTVEVDVSVGHFTARASVPSGASTGKYEAVELHDGGRRYCGLGVQKAVRNVAKIAPRLKDISCTSQQLIDEKLVALDGSRDKRSLGANALLGVSMAACRAGAHALRKPLYSYIGHLNRTRAPAFPRLFFNVINGGKHAGNDLAVQEFMVVPTTNKPGESIRIASEVYHHLRAVIALRYGKHATNIGDEGGFAPPISQTGEALELLTLAISKAGYRKKAQIAVDCAASEFFKKGRYIIDNRSLTAPDLIDYYNDMIRAYPIVSIEDPFHQDDFGHFAQLTRELRRKVHVVTDDLTVTNPHRVRLAVRAGAGNCLLLKINQIGTITEALDAAKLAREHGWRVMVSHRSGETTDDFISDLAVGIGADFMKAGAPVRGERVAKYNQLLRIEEIL